MTAYSKMSASFGDTTIQYNPVPTETRQMVRIKDWWEWTPGGKNIFDWGQDGNPYGANITSVASVKQIPSLSSWTPVMITKQIADWWFRIQKEVMPVGTPDDKIKSTLSHLCGGNIAYCNNTGLGEAYGNRINYWFPNENTHGEKKDIGLNYYVSVGSTHHALKHTSIPGTVKDVWSVEAFNALDPNSFTNLTYKGNEHMFQIATSISRANGLPHNQRVNPFPQAGLPVDRSYDTFTRVLVPLLCNGGNELYVPTYLIDLLPIGTHAPVYPYFLP